MIVNDVKAPVWDANLYLKFADARLRPALDLMGRLDPANAARAGHAGQRSPQLARGGRDAAGYDGADESGGAGGERG